MPAVPLPVLDIWVNTAQSAAVCGPVAIEDHLRDLPGGEFGVADVLVSDERHAAYVPEQTYAVLVTATGGARALFSVRNPRGACLAWPDALAYIQQTQLSGGRGKPHNVGEVETRRWTDDVRAVTGYLITLGDLWVHEENHQPDARGNTGHCSFGFLTRAGELAVAKYLRVRCAEGMVTRIRAPRIKSDAPGAADNEERTWQAKDGRRSR